MLKSEVVDLMPRLLLPYRLRGFADDGRSLQSFWVASQNDVDMFVGIAAENLRWEVSN